MYCKSFSENKKVYFGTFQLIFLYLLVDYQYAITRRDSKEKNNYIILISRLLKARDMYLNKHNTSEVEIEKDLCSLSRLIR